VLFASAQSSAWKVREGYPVVGEGACDVACVPGGAFRVGSGEHFPEKTPSRHPGDLKIPAESEPQIKFPRKVITGDAHLCAPNYCRRFRPAARRADAVDASTSHLGFRCALVKGANDVY
jgi:hypothetical protein